MKEELRKRLEEATEKQLNCATCLARKYGECKESKCLPYRSFLTGVEQGHKEAIEQAKEWLMNYFFFDNSLMSASGCDLFLRRFESDMNKLWEEK